MYNMRIILDAAGGDNAPAAIVQGALDALPLMKEEIVLVGDSPSISAVLRGKTYDKSRLSVVHATEKIENDEPPVRAIRRKKDSSIVKGINMVKNGEGDVFISAGSTGALLAGGLFLLGRVEGIDRPTLATVYPVIGKEPSLLADAGANAECGAKNLLDFAGMGSLYMEKVLGRKNPTVGLVNNGTEEGKGTTLTKEAYALLKESPLNFIGNIEARMIPDGAADVLVTDGFTGNAILKMTEGMGLMFLSQMKKMFLTSAKTKLSALLLKKQLLDLKKSFNYAEYGGAPILGVKGALLKAHGSSDALAICRTVLKAVPYVQEGVVDIIRDLYRS